MTPEFIKKAVLETKKEKKKINTESKRWIYESANQWKEALVPICWSCFVSISIEQNLLLVISSKEIKKEKNTIKKDSVI